MPECMLNVFIIFIIYCFGLFLLRWFVNIRATAARELNQDRTRKRVRGEGDREWCTACIPLLENFETRFASGRGNRHSWLVDRVSVDTKEYRRLYSCLQHLTWFVSFSSAELLYIKNVSRSRSSKQKKDTHCFDVILFFHIDTDHTYLHDLYIVNVLPSKDAKKIQSEMC